MPLPAECTLENLIKQFMLVCTDRSINEYRLEDVAAKLGLRSVEAKIIVFELIFRDGIKSVSPELFGTQAQLDKVYNAIIDYLTNLYEKAEEKEEILENLSQTRTPFSSDQNKK